MTLRDYFAGKALEVFIQQTKDYYGIEQRYVAKWCYEMADEMIEARRQRMTQDEIIELACQTFGGIIKKEERKNFLAFAKLIAEKEREACASIRDSFQARDVGMQPAECADAIRAR